MSLGFRLGKVDIRFQFWFFVVVGLFFIFGREVLGLYIALPILIHEGGHLLVMGIMGIGIESVTFTPFSVDLCRRKGLPLPLAKELVLSLAGITANLVTALLLYRFAFQSMRTMFLIAVNVAVALFNLLPVGNLDGGQVVRMVCERCLLPTAARNVSRLVSIAVLAPLFGLSIFLVISSNANFTLLLTCLYLAFTVIFRD